MIMVIICFVPEVAFIHQAFKHEQELSGPPCLGFNSSECVLYADFFVIQAL